MSITLSTKMIEFESKVRRKSRLLSNYFIKKGKKIKENCRIKQKKNIESFVSKKNSSIYSGGAMHGLAGAPAQAENLILNYNFTLLLFILIIYIFL